MKFYQGQKVIHKVHAYWNPCEVVSVHADSAYVKTVDGELAMSFTTNLLPVEHEARLDKSENLDWFLRAETMRVINDLLVEIAGSESEFKSKAQEVLLMLRN